jgi:hypothetical protein
MAFAAASIQVPSVLLALSVDDRELIPGALRLIFQPIAATLIDDFGRPGAVVRLGSF